MRRLAVVLRKQANTQANKQANSHQLVDRFSEQNGSTHGALHVIRSDSKLVRIDSCEPRLSAHLHIRHLLQGQEGKDEEYLSVKSASACQHMMTLCSA